MNLFSGYGVFGLLALGMIPTVLYALHYVYIERPRVRKKRQLEKDTVQADPKLSAEEVDREIEMLTRKSANLARQLIEQRAKLRSRFEQKQNVRSSPEQASAPGEKMHFAQGRHFESLILASLIESENHLQNIERLLELINSSLRQANIERSPG